MNELLLSAITQTKPWLGRFTRFEYRKAFVEYVNLFGDSYRQAIEAWGAETFAETLLDELDAYWKKQHFWNRAAARVDCRQMVIVYLSPMLMKLGEEDSCETLRQCWAKRWPDTEYRVTSYEKLLNGFRNSVMGIDLAGKHYDEDAD